jgi:hypothetical protein
MSTLRTMINPRTSLRLAMVLPIVIVLIAGCGSPAGQTIGSTSATPEPTASTATPASSGASSYLGPIPRAVSYGDTGITLAVPPDGASPSVSWQSAISNCSTCVAGAPVSVSLALATELLAGQANSDGSIAPVMDKTLVYVLSQSGLTCSPAGPAGTPSSSSTGGSYPCVFLSFVDAHSGTDLYAVDGPGLWDPAQLH